MKRAALNLTRDNDQEAPPQPVQDDSTQPVDNAPVENRAMIAREWRCRCPIRHRSGFLEHLDATGVRECQSIQGFKGYQILERNLGPDVEITLVTYWRSIEDIAAFAGQDITRARLYPDDARFEIKPDQEVRHYSVLAQEIPEA